MVSFKRTALIIHIALVYAQDCYRSSPLGLSNGYISSRQLTSSSNYDNVTFSASHARLNAFSTWCGDYTGPGNWKYEWLQINFGHKVILKGVALRGSQRLSSDDHYVTSFYLQYKESQDTFSFQDITDRNGRIKIFEGVKNNRDPVFHWLPVPLKAIAVRFKAKHLRNEDQASARVCAGLEFYGCGSKKDKTECKSLFTLGMENGAISDAQLSASSVSFATTDATKGRLNRAGKLGWCAKTKSGSEWFQIDIGFRSVITGVSVQGDGHGDCISKYYIYVSNTTTEFQIIRSKYGFAESFMGNNEKTYQDPVLSILKTPVIARYVRISPQAIGKHSLELCMRAEVYGYHPDGPDEILLYDQAIAFEGYSNAPTRVLNSIPMISSMVTHCLDDSLGPKPFLQLELTKIYSLAGISVQGQMTENYWVKSFQLLYSTEDKRMVKMNQIFKGNNEQISIIHHWFRNIIKTSVVRIIALEWEQKPCLKIQLHGSYDGSTVKAEEGKSFVLHCPSRACPQIFTTWYYNNMVISNTESTLYFPEVKEEHEGIYHCIASDSTGSKKSAAIQLVVVPFGDCSRRTHPCKPGFACVRQNTTFVCQCKFEDEDGSCEAQRTTKDKENRNWLILIIVSILSGIFLLIICILVVVCCSRRSGDFSPNSCFTDRRYENNLLKENRRGHYRDKEDGNTPNGTDRLAANV